MSVPREIRSWVADTLRTIPGEIIFLVTARDGEYAKSLTKRGVSQGSIYTDLPTAYNATTTGRNDCILAHPGAYALTTELNWTKSNTHAIGLAGPRCWSDYSEPGVSFYTTTAGNVKNVDLTGNYCQFLGINFSNNGANAGNLTAFELNGYMAHLKGCSFMGAMNTTNDVAAAASLYISDAGSNYVIDDCSIGDANWWVRDTAASGQLAYVGTAAGCQNGLVKNSRFIVASETATVCLVRIAGASSIDRLHTFDNCLFYCFSVNWAATLAACFTNIAGAPQTAKVALRNCSAYNIDQWQTSDYLALYGSTMPVATVGGGLEKEPTAAVS